MKAITISGLVIQFDADQITEGTRLEQAQKAIDLINQTLQREPYGLGAQVFSSGMDDSDIEVEVPEDEEEMVWDTKFGKVEMRGAMIDTDGTNLVDGIEIKIDGKLVGEVLNMTSGQVECMTNAEAEAFVEKHCDL